MEESIRYERHGLAIWNHRLTANPLPMLHRHDELEIGLVESGFFDMLIGGERYRQPQGVLTAFWGAVPHKILDLALPTFGHVLLVPLPWVLGLRLNAVFSSRFFGGHLLACSDPTERDADALAFDRWSKLLGSPSPERERVVLLEVEARLRRLAMEFDTAAPLLGSGVPVGKVEEIIRIINDRFEDDDLSVSAIAEEVGLHPKYATTLFRRACGMPIAKYLTSVRIMRAKVILATEDCKMLDVAWRVGFNAVSQFYTAFREATGVTPSAYRQSLRK